MSDIDIIVIFMMVAYSILGLAIQELAVVTLMIGLGMGWFLKKEKPSLLSGSSKEVKQK